MTGREHLTAKNPSDSFYCEQQGETQEVGTMIGVRLNMKVGISWQTDKEPSQNSPALRVTDEGHRNFVLH
jgi:hypothetical protein